MSEHVVGLSRLLDTEKEAWAQLRNASGLVLSHATKPIRDQERPDTEIPNGR